MTSLSSAFCAIFSSMIISSDAHGSFLPATTSFVRHDWTPFVVQALMAAAMPRCMGEDNPIRRRFWDCGYIVRAPSGESVVRYLWRDPWCDRERSREDIRGSVP